MFFKYDEGKNQRQPTIRKVVTHQLRSGSGITASVLQIGDKKETQQRRQPERDDAIGKNNYHRDRIRQDRKSVV